MKKSLRFIALVLLGVTASIAMAQGNKDGPVEGVQVLMDATDGQAQISVDEYTGLARFVRIPQAGQLASLAPNNASTAKATAQQRAMVFLRSHGSAFGVANANAELMAMGTTRDSIGNKHSVFKQTYNGLPVFAGELRAHFNANGDLYAVNGTFAAKLNVSTTPSLTPDAAAERAIRTVTKQQVTKQRAAAKVSDNAIDPDKLFGKLSAVSINLMVFRAGLVQGIPSGDHLVFEVEVSNAAGSVREFVYIDAHNGKVVDQITGIHEALDRRAFDAEGFAHPGPNYPATPFWVEGDPLPTGNTEADNMIFASEETYDLFFKAFGRDGFDGGGATMDSIFNRGDACPNASWNGTYISFCPGLTTDDITGHEWGHAYTEYTSNLIYQWQSGALNESFSDIWGETVDRINGRDDLVVPVTPRTDGSCSDYGAGGPGDDSVRWLQGEDYGAIRDMWSPNCYGDPGSVNDPVYWCSSGDNGGVHINSGIPNHAFALMTDGGNFNSYSGGGIGLTKAVHIQWAASIMLSQASNFSDNADALESACDNLIGVDLTDLTTGAASGEIIDAGNCSEVADVIDAVEFRSAVSCDFETLLDPVAPALCEGFGSVQSVSFEDFEGGSLPAGWTVSSHDVVDPGTFDNPGWLVVGSAPAGGPAGSFSAFVPDVNAGDCGADTEAGAVALDSPVITLAAGAAPHVAFDHYVATELAWDGGNVKVSVNGGAWTLVPAAAYSFNPYKSALNVSDNPLGGEEAFTGADEGSVAGSWGQSQVNLYGLAFPGDDVRLRFDFGADGCFGTFGWYVDDVHVYSCSAEPLPICGDGALDLGEVCDDGNMDDADGCSSSCEVESGWVCTDPTPANLGGTNIVPDWSFEGGVPNADWTALSTFGGIPGFPLCGPGNSCPAASLANTGSWLVWIGGLAGVTSSVDQIITIPSAATDITLLVLRGICDDASDSMSVSIDGNDIGTIDCDGVDGAYVPMSFPLAPYNDGGSHSLLIEGTAAGTNGTHSNFFVEDVIINDNTPTEAMPSMCTEIVEDLACNAGTVEFDAGIANSWTVVDNEGNGVVWTDITSSDIGGNFTGGTGDAASVNSDANIFTDYDTELISNSFSLQNQASAILEYLANYRQLADDRLDLDISTDGGANWENLLSWDDDFGGFFATPGEAVSIDLAAYLGESDVRVRWHYYNPELGDWDWYAQVDNVALTAPDDADCDGVVDSVDACPGTVFPESVPTQRLGKNRWALVDGDTAFDTNGKQSPAYTLQDTAGCSCEQIIDNLELGSGHTKFGCSNSAITDWIDMLSQ